MLIKAAEAAANPLIPHTAELIVGTIAFTILFLVLRKAVVPNFEKAFAERTEAIQGGIEKAEKAQQEAQAALEQYNSQLASARDEAARLREERVHKLQILQTRFAPRHRKKPHALSQPHMHRSKQSANKQLPLYVMKLELWLSNSLQRLSEKR